MKNQECVHKPTVRSVKVTERLESQGGTRLIVDVDVVLSSPGRVFVRYSTENDDTLQSTVSKCQECPSITLYRLKAERTYLYRIYVNGEKTKHKGSFTLSSLPKDLGFKISGKPMLSTVIDPHNLGLPGFSKPILFLELSDLSRVSDEAIGTVPSLGFLPKVHPTLISLGLDQVLPNAQYPNAPVTAGTFHGWIGIDLRDGELVWYLRLGANDAMLNVKFVDLFIMPNHDLLMMGGTSAVGTNGTVQLYSPDGILKEESNIICGDDITVTGRPIGGAQHSQIPVLDRCGRLKESYYLSKRMVGPYQDLNNPDELFKIPFVTINGRTSPTSPDTPGGTGATGGILQVDPTIHRWTAGTNKNELRFATSDFLDPRTDRGDFDAILGTNRATLYSMFCGEQTNGFSADDIYLKGLEASPTYGNPALWFRSTSIKAGPRGVNGPVIMAARWSQGILGINDLAAKCKKSELSWVFANYDANPYTSWPDSKKFQIPKINPKNKFDRNVISNKFYSPHTAIITDDLNSHLRVAFVESGRGRPHSEGGQFSRFMEFELPFKKDGRPKINQVRKIIEYRHLSTQEFIELQNFLISQGFATLNPDPPTPTIQEVAPGTVFLQPTKLVNNTVLEGDIFTCAQGGNVRFKNGNTMISFIGQAGFFAYSWRILYEQATNQPIRAFLPQVFVEIDACGNLVAELHHAYPGRVGSEKFQPTDTIAGEKVVVDRKHKKKH